MKQFILSTLLGLGSATVIAQGPPPPPQHGKHHDKPDKEEMEAQFVAHVTHELKLTPEESQAFWPVHAKYMEEMKALRKERKGIMKDAKDDGEITDEEAKTMMNSHFEMKEKELAIEKKYHTEFLKVLPPKKVAKYYRAEEGFKRKLLEKMRE
jgi:Spy/CpxP family protein refolding chaperone